LDPNLYPSPLNHPTLTWFCSFCSANTSMTISSFSCSIFCLQGYYHVNIFFICRIYRVILSIVWFLVSCSCNHNSFSLSNPSFLCLYSINALWYAWFASFHASSFFFSSWHSYCKVSHSTILLFSPLFSMVSSKKFTLNFLLCLHFLFFPIRCTLSILHISFMLLLHLLQQSLFLPLHYG
jgi:hypothetical protein